LSRESSAGAFTLRQLEYFRCWRNWKHHFGVGASLHLSALDFDRHLASRTGARLQLFIRHHAQGLSLTPVFGCMVTVAPMLAPELAHSFTEAYPATRVRLVEGNQKELLEGLRRSEVDIALTYDLQIPDDIEFSPLARLPPHVLLSDIHPLAQRSALTLQELESEPLILLDLPLSRGYFLSLFMKEGLSPNIVIRSAHQEVIRTMVANGHGYSLFSARAPIMHSMGERWCVCASPGIIAR
jgi:DNA-binding transcriptional LysR family regulator